MEEKLIFFDLDGTLIDPEVGITSCVQYALQSFGIEEDRRNLRPFIGPPLTYSFKKYYGFSEEKAFQAAEKYRERLRTIGKFENKVYPGIPELLSELHARGDKVILATTKPEIFAREILEHWKLTPYFTEISGSAPNGSHGDKAEVIRQGFARLGLKPEEHPEAVMVGDRCFDVEGAKTCGIRSIAVEYGGFGEPGELDDADFIVKTVEELRACLNGL